MDEWHNLTWRDVGWGYNLDLPQQHMFMRTLRRHVPKKRKRKWSVWDQGSCCNVHHLWHHYLCLPLPQPTINTNLQHDSTSTTLQSFITFVAPLPLCHGSHQVYPINLFDRISEVEMFTFSLRWLWLKPCYTFICKESLPIE